MDLEYGPRYDAFREEVRQFLSENWPPSGDEAQQALAEQQIHFRQAAIAAGYLARSIPRRYGGSEQPADVLEAQIIREEFRRVRAPMEPHNPGPMMLVPTLLERGAEWMRERWIADTLLGRTLWCQGYSEPGSGSDLASLATRGVLDGEEWVVEGQKVWTSGAHEADFMFALVRTEPDATKHAGISYLILEMDQPGIEVRPLIQMSGARDFNEVFLNGARTPADWIVGERGEGWSVSRTTLKHERNSIGSSSLSETLFGALVELAQRSEINGRPALEDATVRERLVAIEAQVMSHRYSGFRQLSADIHGTSTGRLGLMNKIVSTNIAEAITKLGLDLLGDSGLTEPDGRPAQRSPRDDIGWIVQYMWSLGMSIAGGTANIQRNVIAERGLGLPRDYRPPGTSAGNAK